MRLALLCAVLAVPETAAAQAVLWRNLVAGEGIEATKAKLEAMSEIRRVKVIKKRGVSQLDVNMNDGGVPIFEGHFSVDVSFKDGKLASVQLTSGAGCLDDAYPFVMRISQELERKYPEVVSPFPDQNRFMIEALDATSSRAVVVSGGYFGRDVGVTLRGTVVQVDPPTYYGGSAISRSLYQIARSTYDLGAQKCGGNYYRTAQFSLTYLSREDWELIRDQVDRENEVERQHAADNL